MGRAVTMNDTLYGYILEHSLRDHPVLAELREETARLPQAMMQIGADQGQFMAMLVKLAGAKRCLEIGTYTGYSALAVALALPKDGTIVCCDVSEEWTAVGKPFWKKAGVDKKIDLRIAPALDTLKKLKGPFDFVFIDADKENYINYYERCLELVRRGGLIVVDNVLWSGEVADEAARNELTLALRNFNDHVHKDERVDLAMLSIGDGVTLALKK